MADQEVADVVGFVGGEVGQEFVINILFFGGFRLGVPGGCLRRGEGEVFVASDFCVGRVLLA